MPLEEQTFFLNIQSDGEALFVPMKLWTEAAFRDNDYDEQYVLGLYYGILLFVIIIYYFFYRALRERSFLYYVMYVFSLMFLQLNVDGLSFQYLWGNSVWWANHAVPISAALSAFFVILYTQSFLKLKEVLPMKLDDRSAPFKLVS